MSPVLSVILLAGGIALVIAGADAFVDGVVGVGRRAGVAPFVLTVVLSGFELENLAAGIAANAKGLPGAAAGTFLGGTTFLALGITGLGAVISPMGVTLPRPFLAWTAVAPLPLVAFAVDGGISRIEGGLLVAWFAVALTGVARSGRGLRDDEAEEKFSLPRSIVSLIGGLGVLTAGGYLLGEGIRHVVTRLGVSETLLGNTAIAASVEAEELARVAVPARRGRPELALGNIAGTIVHFIAFNAGVIALVKPLSLDHATLHLHLPVAVASTVLATILIGSGRTLGRLDGTVLIALYAGYVAAAIVI